MSTDINIEKRLAVLNEGANITTDATSIDFVGTGVNSSSLGGNVTVTIDGGVGAITYYLNETVTQSPYKEFSSIVTGAAEQLVPLTVAGGVTSVIAEYQTPVGVPGSTQITAGLWSLYLHFNAAVAGQNWIIRPTVYKRDLGGIETLLFTSDPVVVTNMPTVTTMYLSDGVFPATTLLTTDRLVVRLSMENTTGVSQTVTFRTEGSQHYSVATTTLNPTYNPSAVLNVTGTAPIVSSGGTTPAISITQATGATNGYLSSSDWLIFDSKQDAITLTTSGSSGASTFITNTLNVPTYTLSGLGGVPSSRSITINGTTYDLSADRTWNIATSMPQANTIYVDSINGINALTGRGDINTPYLTPEYALGNITNTGTVTATTTNLSATLTAVSSTANIQVGQYITGTGIPYNSTVVSKTVNTIVLSKTCTANATITATWWTAYKVVLVGDFTITSSICKPGFFIDAKTYQSTVSFGAITLFSFDVDYIIPHYTYLHNINGTHANSIFAKGTILYADVQDWYLQFNNFYSIGTSWAIGDASNALNTVNFYVKGNRWEAVFGYASKAYGSLLYWEVNYTYGLLGGHVSGFNDYTIIGDTVCPTTVRALPSANKANVYGNVTGNVINITMLNLYGNLNCSDLTTSNGGSGTLFRSNFYGNVIATTFNNGSFAEIHGTFQGALINNGTYATLTQCNFLNAIIGGSITITNGSVYANGYSQSGGSITVNGGSFYNNSSLTCGIITIGAAGSFENNGDILTNYVTYTGAGKFLNYGKLRGYGGYFSANGCVRIINGGTFVNNGTVQIENTGDNMTSTIIKTSGNFVNNGFISNAWGLLVNYTVNTIPERNIALGYARSNGRGGVVTSTSGNGRIFRLDVSLANTNTSITINDGVAPQTFSVVGAGKSIVVIQNELITLINASTLLFASITYNTTFGSLWLVEGLSAPLTLSALTNIVLTSTTAASFTGNVLVGGTELSSQYFTN
jgi:hypothetical protein